MTNKSEFKVVKIISDMSVVLNVGKNDGINVDDTFDIVSEYSIDVTDPDTGDNLGTIKYIKASIIATVVYEKMCICQNVKCYDSAIETISKTLSNYNKSRMPLNVDTTQISGGFEDAEKQIRIGDKAIKTN